MRNDLSATWPNVATFLILGYLSMSRAFAYIGVPAWNVFIGEAVLVLLFVAGPRIGGHRWFDVLGKAPSLKQFLILYGLFLGFGIFEVARGIASGASVLVALRDLTFHYYPVYFFLGLWSGWIHPARLPQLVRSFAWINGIYGALYVLFLNQLDWFFPGVGTEVVPVQIFGQPIFSFIALLGILAYEKNLLQTWCLVLLNGFVMLAMQIRTEWLAFAIGLIMWCFLTRQSKRVLHIISAAAALLAILYITDVRLPSPQGRAADDLSARQLVDRVAAPFRADLGDQAAAAGAEGVDSQEATFVFRTVWWLAIWNSVHSSAQTAILGHGYGFALGDLVPYLQGSFIRTPHNEFFYALGYGGWLGVAVFSAFQFGLLRLLLRARQISGDPFGVVLWVSMNVLGMFFPVGEAPYAAIPFYLLIGWLAAPAVFLSRRALVPRSSSSSIRMPSNSTGACYEPGPTPEPS
jgi:O-Antigen ligase